MHFTELDTPALCIDLDVLEKNIDDLQSACNRLEIPLRVHTKTHKTPAIARKQIAARNSARLRRWPPETSKIS